MSRSFFAVVLLSWLLLMQSDGIASKPLPPQQAEPKSNQIYLKIILPIDAPQTEPHHFVVETWIAEHLKNAGVKKFTAATPWFPLNNDELSEIVWNGTINGQSYACPVGGKIVSRSKGTLEVVVDGWAPCAGVEAKASIADEPGSRVIIPVKIHGKDHYGPYVAILIGPPIQHKMPKTDGDK